MKFIKSNIGFIIILAFLAVIALNPQLKALVLQGLLKIGLYRPDVENTAYNAENPNLQQVRSVVFEDSSGERIDISEARGKVIFLNFWATWCPPCIAEMPSIQALHDKIKDKNAVLFIMVDVDSKMNASMNFMKKKNYNLPVYMPASAIPETLFKGNLPTTAIINKQGEIVFHHEGLADYNSSEMEEFINELAN